MSTPVTPADYFQPVLASARLQNELSDELTASDLRRKVAENLRINFLRIFQPNTATDIPEPASITTSPDNVERVNSLYLSFMIDMQIYLISLTSLIITSRMMIWR
jgi:hypothetical protein